MRPLRLILAAATSLLAIAACAQGPDFSREVRPILSQHCLKCHGPDDKQRAAGLRLDLRAVATARGAIVPGKPDKSALVTRIFAHGASQMPPVTANKPLSDAEKALLRRWVAAGAKYAPHWAFVKPVKAPLPGGKRGESPIDAFVRQRLVKAGLKPSPEVDRYTLIRRVSLDLIGLPPTPEEVDAFVADTRPGAYERVVDRLLASPHYGERWARRWLDLARYADTNGYEKDRPRSMWLWRDWVIRSLNADKPFDTFTIEQIAGDLLPGATVDQKIATGFHRNTMRNEEGGIDPLEYRFLSMVDRVATTGTTWLGLTVGCAQCHTHKFDPIPHRDYFRLMAFLDNADEPEREIVQPEILARRQAIQSRIARAEAALPEKWPLPSAVRWEATKTGSGTSGAGATVAVADNGTVRVEGANPDTDTYTVGLAGPDLPVAAVRLEAFADPTLGGGGPGRTPHGNFVLSEIEVKVDGKPVKLVRAEADAAQDGFPASDAIDGDPKTGWAIHVPNTKWNVDRTATFWLDTPTAGHEWTVTLRQSHGSQHTLGKFRLTLGASTGPTDPQTLATRRDEAIGKAFAAWTAQNTPRAVHWTPLTPLSAKSNAPTLTVQPDGSVLSGGDQTKSDLYTVRLRTAGSKVRAVRLEALADPRLPRSGPGRVDYEGTPGDFYLNEFKVLVGGGEATIARAVSSFAAGGNTAARCIDHDMLTGWGIGGGGVGRSHSAVFTLAAPIDAPEITVTLACERYYASDLGRFRISVTADEVPDPLALPDAIEAILATPVEKRTAIQRHTLFDHFLQTAPELASARAEIEKLRQSLPAYPTALVLEERPAHDPRATLVRRRGEFLQPQERVTPGVPAFLNPLPAGAPANRLTFARWLVSKENPLTARVTVNRQWQALFGRGLVPTVEDFGYQGQPPSHPELLDWLAVEFMESGWSLKKLHRLMVTSATYRQSSALTPDAARKDPTNVLLSRGPRVRLDAELVRDAALAESGLLSHKRFGPSVFPPQPPGVTSEGAYGPLTWTVSAGEDRYRRGLYTFAKRTAPYAMFLTFDGGSGEACLARREVSNTPLQALTLLNDPVFIEAAQALGRTTAARTGDDAARAVSLFRRILTRPPQPDEVQAILGFVRAQSARFAAGVDPKPLAGPGDGDPAVRAAWTAAARSLLNVDEAIVKR